MARARSSSGGRGGLRTVALAAAVAIALASTAAVVLSDDPETLRLAVVGALWAFVLAAFAAPRRRESEPATGDPGGALELRRTYEIELEKEVAARREYELQLEVYLRRELERGLAEDVAALRDEVGRMRGEMIDRLDGELRMERIETTRLIGGSLRALQDEARRLGIGMPVPPELSAAVEADFAGDPLGRGSASGVADYGPPTGQPDFAAPLGSASYRGRPDPGPAGFAGQGDFGAPDGSASYRGRPESGGLRRPGGLRSAGRLSELPRPAGSRSGGLRRPGGLRSAGRAGELSAAGVRPAARRLPVHAVPVVRGARADPAADAADAADAAAADVRAAGSARTEIPRRGRIRPAAPPALPRGQRR